jgi:hypothetical protein
VCLGDLLQALVDEEAVLKVRQATEFIQTFINLLQHRSLSRTGLHRLAVGLSLGLTNDHPEGFGASPLACAAIAWHVAVAVIVKIANSKQQAASKE